MSKNFPIWAKIISYTIVAITIILCIVTIELAIVKEEAYAETPPAEAIDNRIEVRVSRAENVASYAGDFEVEVLWVNYDDIQNTKIKVTGSYINLSYQGNDYRYTYEEYNNSWCKYMTIIEINGTIKDVYKFNSFFNLVPAEIEEYRIWKAKPLKETEEEITITSQGTVIGYGVGTNNNGTPQYRKITIQNGQLYFYGGNTRYTNSNVKYIGVYTNTVAQINQYFTPVQGLIYNYYIDTTDYIEEGIRIADERVNKASASYKAGLEDANTYTFRSLINAVIETPITVMVGLMNVELLGVNLKDFMLGLIGVAIALVVIRKIYGR